MITLSNGKKYFGKLQSYSESTIMLLTLNNGNLPCKNQEIVSLSPFNEKFADRISANISLGYDLAISAKKSSLLHYQELHCLSGSKSSADVSFYTLRSKQDSVEGFFSAPKQN